MTNRWMSEKGGVMEIGLDDGSVLGLDGKNERFLVRCVSGCLYLTRTGDPHDYFLKPGEQMAIEARHQVVVEAFGDVRFKCITAAAETRGRGAEVWHLAGAVK